MEQPLKVSVIGAGYVGLVTGGCLAGLGHEVVCTDNDVEKLKTLESGRLPIYEPGLDVVIAEARKEGRLSFRANMADAVRAGDAIFICVGTPPLPNGSADLSAIDHVARLVATEARSPKLVVEKSTVPAQTGQELKRALGVYGRKSGVKFSVASNPEFLREGTAVEDFLHPDRIVVGADSERASELLSKIYSPLTGGDYYQRPDAIPGCCSQLKPPTLLQTSTKSAEIIKHASNAFLALKISFINAVSNLCEATNANVEQVARGMGLDSRIGPRFLRPGIGYGGSCFPKDVAAFRSVAEQLGIDFNLLSEVEKINAQQKRRFLSKVRSALWTLRGKRLAVLGLSFKGDTDDIRESPAIDLVEIFLAEGCTVVAYDPAAMARAESKIP